MWVERKNDQTVMKAIEAQNRGDLRGAERLFRDAGNQYRNPNEKELLWKAAERVRQVRLSD